jgi:hypothetical protein
MALRALLRPGHTVRPLRRYQRTPAHPEAMSHVFTTSERILEAMENVTGEYAKLA